MSVKRYDPEDWGGLHMEESKEGGYVSYKEHQEIVDKLEKKIKQHEENVTNNLRGLFYGR